MCKIRDTNEEEITWDNVMYNHGFETSEYIDSILQKNIDGLFFEDYKELTVLLNSGAKIIIDCMNFGTEFDDEDF